MILGETVKNTETQKTRSKNPLGMHKTMEMIKDIAIDLYITVELYLVNCGILNFQDCEKLSNYFLCSMSGIDDMCYHKIYYSCIST